MLSTLPQQKESDELFLQEGEKPETDLSLSAQDDRRFFFGFIFRHSEALAGESSLSF